MGAITQITVQCIKQEDYTGEDDLNFYMNDSFIGTLRIGTGQTHEVVGPGLLFGDTIWCDSGSNLKIYEFDLVDSSDLMLDHTFSDSDMDNTITLYDCSSSAEYVFTVTTINI